jgi:hypothetical protein
VGKRKGAYHKPFRSVWIAFDRERIFSNPSLKGPIIVPGAHFNSLTVLPERNLAFLVRSASIDVKFRREAGAIVA